MIELVLIFAGQIVGSSENWLAKLTLDLHTRSPSTEFSTASVDNFT
jgi:hypothetical protein